MRRLAVLIMIGVALLLGAAPARAGTIVDPPSGAFPYQAWSNASRMPTPDVTLHVVESRCPSADASACTSQGSYTIWMSPQAFSPRATFLHELGHNFDYYAMTDADRDGFLQLLRRVGPWRTGGSVSPSEIFAEAWRMCARPRFLRSEAAPRGLQRRGRLGAACALIRRAA